jgi:hypothetical protein
MIEKIKTLLRLPNIVTDEFLDRYAHMVYIDLPVFIVGLWLGQKWILDIAALFMVIQAAFMLIDATISTIVIYLFSERRKRSKTLVLLDEWAAHLKEKESEQ